VTLIERPEEALPLIERACRMQHEDARARPRRVASSSPPSHTRRA
jgi:hypothetical protein